MNRFLAVTAAICLVVLAAAIPTLWVIQSQSSEADAVAIVRRQIVKDMAEFQARGGIELDVQFGLLKPNEYQRLPTRFHVLTSRRLSSNSFECVVQFTFTTHDGSNTKRTAERYVAKEVAPGRWDIDGFWRKVSQ